MKSLTAATFSSTPTCPPLGRSDAESAPIRLVASAIDGKRQSAGLSLRLPDDGPRRIGRKLSPTLSVPSLRSGPGDCLDAEQRWAIIATLLRAPGIEAADRVAGSFVLLYAQTLSRIAVMTADAVAVTGSDVSVRFGTQDVLVPAPLATHITDLITTGRAHHVGIGSTPSRWLFPGHLPGRPITATRLGQRLSAFGIDGRAARRAAQAQLAAQVPAVVLAEMLGIAVGTAVDWVHAAGGDWANYAGITATDAGLS